MANMQAQQPPDPSPRSFYTTGAAGDVKNIAGNMYNGDHIENHYNTGTILALSSPEASMTLDLPAHGQMSLFPNFVVPDAAYNSRTTRTRCLDGTREPVIATILGWKVEVNASSMCWLSGPAGSGKSAVLQSVAESCARDGTLAASFFFLRGAGQRSEFNHFITTLAFQIATCIPGVDSLIQKALRDDPTIPHKSTTTQLHTLILQPLMALRGNLPRPRFLVIIDALDECNDQQFVQDFITVLADACSHEPLPLLWLLASRREEHIRKAFSKEPGVLVTNPIRLEDFDAHTDIEKFLRARFDEIFKDNPRLFPGITFPWPSPEKLEGVVNKSSGLFIFASTLVKFITDGKAPPDRKLESVLEMHAGLDPLYDQVIRAVPEIVCFRRVLTTLMLVYKQPSAEMLAAILELHVQDVLHALMPIQSIINIPSDDSTPIQLNHTSLRDFLVDAVRSKDLFIDPPVAHATIAVGCIKHLQRNLKQDVLPERAEELYAAQYWPRHLQDAHNTTGASYDLSSILKDFSSLQVMEPWINTLMELGLFRREVEVQLAELSNKYRLSGDDLALVVENIKTKLEDVRRLLILPKLRLSTIDE
ncbi:hypothetical protein HWV62_31965 [Athelia sp. TMB]|nr:hypothetical protein HWV62_31965 [Athelia sp. TMB]